jgi:hypothetical protein
MNDWLREHSSLDVDAPPQKGLARQPSQRARVDAFIEDFLSGEPIAQLIRPNGEGMEPPFTRMKFGHERVVEMRTPQTRTFGFFHKPNYFVAATICLTNDLKRKKNEPDKALQCARYSARAQRVERLIDRLYSTEVSSDDIANLVI